MSEIKNHEVTTLKCSKKCCTILQSKYVHVVYTDSFYTKSSKITKAGCFIYDFYQKKVLLIQSRGKFFGAPKGSLSINENICDGALREVMEETGIQISKEDLMTCAKFPIKNTLYYILAMNECQVEPQLSVKDNDANSIGWIHVECLKDMVASNVLQINKHTKILIKKIFHVELDVKTTYESVSSDESEK